jgi:DNA-binding IclR family transcriptional regulator
MNNHMMESALRVLFLLAREDIHADLSLLAQVIGAPPIEAGRQLAELERHGLVDAHRVRLTMTGLVVAASLDAQERKADGKTREATLRAIHAA